MDILNTFSQALYPGHRVIRVKGWQGMKSYPLPRDCEAIFIDEDPNVNIMYMKKVDVNGGESYGWYDFTERPNPEFDPEKYLTKEEFNKRIEEVIDAINSNRKPVAYTNGTSHK